MTYKVPYDLGLTEIGGIHMIKSEPGRYFDSKGIEVDAEVARTVGFPVDKQLAERRVRERMVGAEERIRREVKLEEIRLTYEKEPPFRSGHKGSHLYYVYHFDTPKESVYEGRRAEVEAKCHELNEALYRRMAGFPNVEAAPPASSPSSVPDAAEAASGLVASAAGGGGEAA